MNKLFFYLRAHHGHAIPVFISCITSPTRMQSTSIAEALAWVDDDRAIRQFLRPPYMGHLKTHGPNKFMYDDQKLRGLTDPLRECFWPQEASGVARKRFYAQDPAKKLKTSAARQIKQVTKKPGFFDRPAAVPLKKKKPNNLKQASLQALRHGSLVHRQIDQVVKLGVNEYLDKNDGIDPHALAIIIALHTFEPELRILCTEYVAGCPTLGIATRIDQICVDKSGRLYVVETKTGSPTDHSWSGYNGMMRAPLADYFGNSSHNRAKVQAIAGAMFAILGTQLSLGGQVRCLVAHVNDKQVKLKLVPDAVVATTGPIIYAALLAHQTRRKHRTTLKQIKQEGAAAPAKKRKQRS